MSNDNFGVIKGLTVQQTTDRTKQVKLEVDSGATTNTATTLNAAQTANRTLSLPDATDTLVGKATIDTLSNKTLNNTNVITVQDANLTIQDNGDNTKQAKFEASGITTGTTRTFTLPDANTTVVGTATTQTISNKILDNTNTATLQDANFTLQDNGDNTKQLKFEASGITTGTTRTLTAPDANTTIVGTDATQTISNKTLGITNVVTVLDSNLTVQDNADNTKQAKFEASGITTATTRTFTLPDANTTLVGHNNIQAISNKDFNNSNSYDVKDSNFTLEDDGDATRQVTFQLSNITTGNLREIMFPDADATLVGTTTTQTLSNKTLASPTVTTLESFSNQAEVRYAEQTGNGTNYVGFKAPDAVTTNTIWKLPNGDGAANSILTTDGSANLSFTAFTASSNESNLIENLGLAGAASGGTLTFSVKQADGTTNPAAGAGAVRIGFKNETLTDGGFSLFSITAAHTLALPGAGTLGGVSASPLTIFVYEVLSTPGTGELAVSAAFFEENSVQTTTAVGAGSTSQTTLYSTSAITGPVRMLGYQVATNTAGSWANPTKIILHKRHRSPVQRRFTSGTTTYLPTEGTIAVQVGCLGGGGGGGGAEGNAGQAGMGVGGGGGSYAESYLTSGFIGQTITVGSSTGNGGATGNNAGTAGGTSSFGALVSAAGGAGGNGGAASATVAIADIGSAGGTATAGDLLATGGYSWGVFRVAATSGLSGNGGAGAGPYGTSGGRGRTGSASGNNIGGFGGGGSGGVTNQNVDQAGADGDPGLVVITEYF